jgi:hypothetical protein
MKDRFPSLGLILLSLVTAASAAERLPAYSNTAMSITGDVTLGADRITFANGKSIAVKKVVSGREGKWDPIASGKAKADVYELTKPQDPKLLRGNRPPLCPAFPFPRARRTGRHAAIPGKLRRDDRNA